MLILPTAFLILAYSAFLLLPLFLEGFFVFEMVSLTMPYWTALNIILLVSLVIFALPNASGTPGYILKTSILLLSVVTLFLIFNLVKFSFIKVPIGAGEKNISIAFFNKLYSNTNYNEIDQKVSQLNPDIIGFSEFKRVDILSLPSLKNYPYYFYKNARDGATISYFSKYQSYECPCSSLEKEYTLPIISNIDGKEYLVFVIHPLPPANNHWVKERNRQLRLLSNFIKEQESSNILVMGDFNLSPWSKTFSNLTQNFLNLKSTAQGLGFFTTWHNRYLATQIDHIFVPVNFLIDDFQSIPVSGSDHNLIFVNAKI